jgi:lysophospholipase L1-like esterase
MDVALGLKPNLKIIWNEQVIPDLDHYPGHDARHELINQAINDVMNEYSARGYDTWVSRVAAAWDPATDLDLDGVHPSDAGFRKLGARHYETFRQAYGMPNPQPVPEPGLMVAGALGALALLHRRRQA